MVQRINFLATGKYAMTYRNMAIALGLWVGLCALIQLGFVGETWVAETKVKAMKDRMRVLQVRQDRKLQLLEATKSKEQAGTAMQSLSTIFVDTPAWSTVLNGLSSARPVALDLFSMKGEKSESHRYHLVLEGHAESMDAVNEFLGRLNEQHAYESARLTESSRDVEAGKLRFVISSLVRFTGS
jgi:hypothetical protein